MARQDSVVSQHHSPKLSIIELVDVSRIQWRFDRVSRRVPVAEPWTSPIAEILDSKTLDEWLRYVHASASTRDLMAIMARVTWGCEPDAVSMLHAVRYVKAAGGLGRMLDVKGGAQQDRFPGGTQQIALRMAEELAPRVVLNAVVRSIERHADGAITVGSDRGDVSAKAVILAIPPAHRVGIEFIPELPAEYGKLAQHWPQGSLSKAYAAYETPFWRENGCSGEAVSDEGPVFITFDVSPVEKGPGILLGFTDAHAFDPFSPDDAVSVRWPVSPRCSGTRRCSRSTTSTTVGGQRISRPEARRPRYRRVRGPATGRGYANRSNGSSGPGPRPPTSGPGSSTVPSGRGGERRPRCTGNCRART